MTTTTGPEPDPEPSSEARVLALLAELVAELYPGSKPRIGLSTRLDADLGLDSLARSELVVRASRRFGVDLPESALARLETPADLVAMLAGSAGTRPGGSGSAPGASQVQGGAIGLPTDAQTLVEVLEHHAEHTPDRVWMLLRDEDGNEQPVTYGALHREAGRVAAALQAKGVGPGSTVAVMLPTGLGYFAAFFGALRAGGVPVPLYPPARPSQLEDHLGRQARILANCRARILVTVPEARTLGRVLRSRVEGLEEVVGVEDLDVGSVEPARPRTRGEDLAFLQYTSGSTGNPKGVELTHAQLLANLRAFGYGIEPRAERDVFVSWLPLYHDLGLIGAALGTLYYGVPFVLMSPLAFLGRPSRWLEAMSRHRATLTAAPNFAYELCASRVPDEEIAGLDLSAWRMGICGAEPVSPGTMRRFAARFAPHGFKAEALAPCYGMAELALGLSITPLARGARVDRVRREEFAARGQAVPAGPEEADALEFIACGPPLPGYRVRIVDPSGEEVPERVVGRLLYQGPSATDGYHRNPEATAALRRWAKRSAPGFARGSSEAQPGTREPLAGERWGTSDWLDSGDLAYLAEGEIVISGRAKDLILKGGRNLVPQEIEEAAGAVAGIRTGCVAAFGVADADSGTENVVVVAETRARDRAAREALVTAVREAVSAVIGMPPDEVVLVPPGSVLKTSSGKIRRDGTRELYLGGRLGAGATLDLGTRVRLGCEAAWGLALGVVEGAARLVYAAWWWAWFLSMGAIGWLVSAFAPWPALRWRVLKAVCRAFLVMTRTRVECRGFEHLPASGNVVVVANHQSYLDAPVLLAVAPRRLRPVVKSELRESFVGRRFFGGLDALFVERFDAVKAVEDQREVEAAAARGDGVVVFPEGTFQRVPGLLPFKMGAFQLAARLGLPIVPVAIAGTRWCLEPDQGWPRPGTVVLTAGPPVVPSGADLEAAVALRDRTRAFLLEHCGEPDRERR